MAERDLLSWNSLISGYGCNGFLQLALELLGTMRCRDIHDAANVFALMDKSDGVTWNSMIFGFADLGINEQIGARVFQKNTKHGLLRKSNEETGGKKKRGGDEGEDEVERYSKGKAFQKSKKRIRQTSCTVEEGQENSSPRNGYLL
ncbi:hypothetical protein RHMOL_Rhmol03G0292000 [Rhododendron molle]|uniref:Uncharacterized protein n=1 Tax=Rhododendron molle TaxID=49168 RepID=A0ACC0PKZ9_RHOML|nr:hypothetical protein RHMOL_Rhmol03G0292000 [Rhododendron molle]